MVTQDENNNSVLVGMQIQLGEIKGILNTIVQEHARRITDQEAGARQLRFDLDSVKTEAKKDVSELQEKLNQMAIKSHEDGGKILQGLNNAITTNKNNIEEIRTDVVEIKEKQNNAWSRVWPPLALILTGIGLAWQVVGK